MPSMCFRLAPVLCLALALSACAPANKAAAPTGTAKSAKNTAPAQSTAPKTAPNQGKNGFRVVMGKPLPEDAAGRPAATPAQVAAAPQAATPAPAAPSIQDQVPAPFLATAATPAPAVPDRTPAPLAAPGAAPATAMGPTPDQAAGLATPGLAPPGFGGLKWGDAAHTFPGLALHETDKAAGVTTCIWPQGPKDIFGAPIREAYYEFHKDRFYHVWIEFDGLAAYKTALEGLVRAYGPPTQENAEKYYHAWNLGDVNVYCAYHPTENDGDVSYFYQPIYEPMMAARKAQAKPAPRSRKP
ncbi:MAG: hypothetical protein ACP59X_14030 [Solidesulfovibrio sp. DCME]|uniref:hypothetical protein n=1 Tax=Solidesulfovibrio sp. DCME TaxID=3447380 RepID=UPI003D118D03